MRRSGWPAGAGCVLNQPQRAGAGRDRLACDRRLPLGPGQFDIGLRDRSGQRQPRRRHVERGGARRGAGGVDRGGLSPEQVDRPVQIGLRLPQPLGRPRIGWRDDIAAGQPVILFLRVQRHRGAVIGAACGQHRLRLPQPGQRDVERGIAAQRIADDPVELRIAQPTPPVGGDQRRLRIAQSQRLGRLRGDSGMRLRHRTARQQQPGQ